MPGKRDILSLLTRDELLENLDYYELEVDDRRIKDSLVEAIGTSRTASLDEILEDLPRDRLKAVCRELDLDDGGREIVTLVDRLMGREASHLTLEVAVFKGSLHFLK